MAYFASDRDLLVLEPNLFRDIGWSGQRLVKGTGSVSGTTLTMSSQDAGFDAAGVTAGHVVVVGGTSYEVLSRVSGAALTISRLRDSALGPGLPPSAATGVEATVTSFGPQIASAHRQVLRLLGIEPEDAAGPGVISESAITNPGALTRLTALGALFLIMSAAAGLGGPDSGATAKAEWYRQRFADERRRVGVRVDTDGDGVADATRGAVTGITVERV